MPEAFIHRVGRPLAPLRLSNFLDFSGALLLLKNERHLFRSEYLKAEHDGSALLGLEHDRLLRRYVQHALVPGRVTHERHVDSGRQLLVQFDQLTLEYFFFLGFGRLFHESQVLRYLRETLDELGRGHKLVQALPLLVRHVGVMRVLLEDVRLVTLVNRIRERIKDDVLSCQTARAQTLLILRRQRRIYFLVFHVRIAHALVLFVELVLAQDTLNKYHPLKLLLLDDALVVFGLVIIIAPDTLLELLVLEDARIEVTHVQLHNEIGHLLRVGNVELLVRVVEADGLQTG